MSDDDATTKHEPTHLPVLPHSGKVDQLRREAMADPQQQLPTADQVAEVTLPAESAPTALVAVEDKLLEGKIIAALKTVYDPEIPVDIYELGLIYKIEIDAEKNVTLKMTLTAPACPVAGTLPGEVEQRVKSVEGVKDATVELVWDPPWSRDMMSETALLTLGMI
jgi:FeS assembly SUF system protein